MNQRAGLVGQPDVLNAGQARQVRQGCLIGPNVSAGDGFAADPLKSLVFVGEPRKDLSVDVGSLFAEGVQLKLPHVRGEIEEIQQKDTGSGRHRQNQQNAR